VTTTPSTLRVFVDARGHDVPAGATALDAVRIADPAMAAEVESGDRIITDSRGLPLPAGERVESGAILRLIRNRASDPAPE
jgi:hypothetical protein